MLDAPWSVVAAWPIVAPPKLASSNDPDRVRRTLRRGATHVIGRQGCCATPTGPCGRLGLTAEAHHLLLDDVTRGLADIAAG